MTTNTAFRVHSYGGPETMKLDEIDVSTPAPGQYLVQVKAVGVNPIDWKLREGFLSAIYQLPFPAVIGSEFAGEVIKVGEGATRFSVGDRVMSFRGGQGGAYADTVVEDEAKLATIPEPLSYVEAAALPVAALTAWQILRVAGELRPGMNVLIHGASGSVGGFAVQFAKAAGATVVTTASAANRDYLLGLGAFSVIDYRTQRFEDLVDNVDLVLDLVGGETLDRSWSVLAPEGAIVSIADPAGITARAPAGARAFFNSTKPDPERLEEIASEVAEGRLRSTIAKVFPKAELPEGIQSARTRHAPGKIIVDFSR
jgi:NADPH:quinone reductase-like Zn-dependent oxidoreductase